MSPETRAEYERELWEDAGTALKTTAVVMVVLATPVVLLLAAAAVYGIVRLAWWIDGQ